MIDEDFAEAIALFKEACMFRSCSQVQIWKKENLTKNSDEEVFECFRAFKNSDAKAVLENYMQNIFPQFRHSLQKDIRDFKSPYLIDFNKNRQKFVIENPKNKAVEGYFTVVSNGRDDFWMDCSISLPYQEYFYDVLRYYENIAFKTSENPSLFIYLRKYYECSQRFQEILENNAFKCIKSHQVLVKDYWKPIKAENDKEKSPIFIHCSANPAH
jgi:hypothetical protein